MYLPDRNKVVGVFKPGHESVAPDVALGYAAGLAFLNQNQSHNQVGRYNQPFPM